MNHHHHPDSDPDPHQPPISQQRELLFATTSQLGISFIIVGCIPWLLFADQDAVHALHTTPIGCYNLCA